MKLLCGSLALGAEWLMAFTPLQDVHESFGMSRRNLGKHSLQLPRQGLGLQTLPGLFPHHN